MPRKNISIDPELVEESKEYWELHGFRSFSAYLAWSLREQIRRDKKRFPETTAAPEIEQEPEEEKFSFIKFAN
jgi:hypothetical protein